MVEVGFLVGFVYPAKTDIAGIWSDGLDCILPYGFFRYLAIASPGTRASMCSSARGTPKNKQMAHSVARGLSQAFEPSAPEVKPTYHLIDAPLQVVVGKVGEHWLGM